MTQWRVRSSARRSESFFPHRATLSNKTTTHTTMSKILVPKLLAGSPSLEDGFRGARDAEILARHDHDEEISSVHVQATRNTRDLLKRAGYARTFTGAFYAVKVATDDFGRLQIAPAKG